MEPISVFNAEHYVWGEVCDAWHLLKRGDLSVNQERVPAGASEVMHFHNMARQFFYILEGEGLMVFQDRQAILQKGDGLEIPPGVRHQFRNQSERDVHFLVISMPAARADRVNV
jgi:mannose-6-phosphate isomerase-like protein (cupin superfamily)